MTRGKREHWRGDRSLRTCMISGAAPENRHDRADS